MRYRRLSTDELTPLQEEFLKYLLVAGINPSEWESLKLKDIDLCNQHIDIFSDLVFDKILNDIQYIDVVSSQSIAAYFFTKEKAYLFAISAKKGEELDFNQNLLKEINFSKVDFFKGEKEYVKERNDLIFEISQKIGAKVSQGELFKQLSLSYADFT